jgi:hypothetical protein
MLQLSQADDLLTLTCDKQKDEAPFDPMQLTLVPQHGGSVIIKPACDAPATGALTEHQQLILTALRDTFGGSARTEELHRALPSMTERTFQRALRRLVDRGFVHKGGGHHAPNVLTPAGRTMIASPEGGRV